MKKRRLLVVAIGMALSEAALAQECAMGFSSATGMEPCMA